MTTSTFGDIVSRGLNWLLTGGVRVILILGAIFLGLFLLRRALTKLQNFLEGSLPDTAKVKRARTLTHVLGDMVRLIIVAVGTLMVLSELGIDLTPLLMAAGVGGIAIGFGAQNLVKDIITGFLSCLKTKSAWETWSRLPARQLLWKKSVYERRGCEIFLETITLSPMG